MRRFQAFSAWLLSLSVVEALPKAFENTFSQALTSRQGFFWNIRL